MKKWQKGFSLIEAMVGVGLLAGSGLFLMKISQEQISNLAKAEYEIEAEASLLKVMMNLNEPRSCSQMLSGQITGAEIPGGLNILSAGGSPINILRVGEYHKFQVNSIRLEPHPTFPTTAVDLVMEFSPRGSGRVSAYFNSLRSTLRKRLSVVAALNGTMVRSCGPVVSDTNNTAKKNLCNSMAIAPFGAVWDNTNQRCISRLVYPTPFTCPAGQLPHYVQSIGDMICANAIDVVNLRILFGVAADNQQAVGLDCPSRRLVLGTRDNGQIFLRCFNSSGFWADDIDPQPFAVR